MLVFFILCLYCGLHFCNIKDITYKNVDYTNRLLKSEAINSFPELKF